MSGAHTATGPRDPVPVQFPNRLVRRLNRSRAFRRRVSPPPGSSSHQQACLSASVVAFPRLFDCRGRAWARCDALSLISENARTGQALPCAACFRETERARFMLKLAAAWLHSAQCRSKFRQARKRAFLSQKAVRTGAPIFCWSVRGVVCTVVLGRGGLSVTVR